jgi:hypothetical protein
VRDADDLDGLLDIVDRGELDGELAELAAAPA